MPDIELMGAIYPDVPAINLPKADGGIATFFADSGDLAWLGKNVEQVSGEFYSKIDTLKNTLYNGWTPSSTAKAIVASTTLSSAKFTAENLDKWAYYIIWECGVNLAYTGTPTDIAKPLLSRGLLIQELIRKPSTWTAVQSKTMGATANQAAYGSTFLRYYNNSGTLTYTWAASYGFYNGATAPTIASTSNLSTTITPKTPTLTARTSTTYMNVDNANLIDQDSSIWWIKGANIYRAQRDTFYDGVYKLMCDIVNASPPVLPIT